MYFINSSLLVRVLEQVFLFAAYFYSLLDGKVLNIITVPLRAGASADDYPADGGAFTFNVDGPSSWLDWTRGSAKKYRSMVYP